MDYNYELQLQIQLRLRQAQQTQLIPVSANHPFGIMERYWCKYRKQHPSATADPPASLSQPANQPASQPASQSARQPDCLGNPHPTLSRL